MFELRGRHGEGPILGFVVAVELRNTNVAPMAIMASELRFINGFRDANGGSTLHVGYCFPMISGGAGDDGRPSFSRWRTSRRESLKEPVSWRDSSFSQMGTRNKFESSREYSTGVRRTFPRRNSEASIMRSIMRSTAAALIDDFSADDGVLDIRLHDLIVGNGQDVLR